MSKIDKYENFFNMLEFNCLKSSYYSIVTKDDDKFKVSIKDISKANLENKHNIIIEFKTKLDVLDYDSLTIIIDKINKKSELACCYISMQNKILNNKMIELDFNYVFDFLNPILKRLIVLFAVEQLATDANNDRISKIDAATRVINTEFANTILATHNISIL